MSRKRLDNRHFSVTTHVEWQGQKLVVTYGFDITHNHVREAFCAAFKRESDVVALANDAAILLSRLLQHENEHIETIAKSLGENRVEGQTSGPPASLIGAIARRGAEVEREVAGKDSNV